MFNEQKWQQDNPENPTGTNVSCFNYAPRFSSHAVPMSSNAHRLSFHSPFQSQYVPYSTTKPKIQAWDPSRK